MKSFHTRGKLIATAMATLFAVSPALAVALTGAALSVLGALHLRLRRSTA